VRRSGNNRGWKEGGTPMGGCFLNESYATKMGMFMRGPGSSDLTSVAPLDTKVSRPDMGSIQFRN